MNLRIKSRIATLLSLVHIVAKALISFVMSVRPSSRINKVPTGRISVKLYTENFCGSLLRKFKFDKNRAKISSTLHDDVSGDIAASDIKST
jgi:hypothetical protein